MAATTLSQARLHELFHYDKDTGVFTRRVRCGPIVPGRIAGCVSGPKGYVVFQVGGTMYYAHRIAWLYLTGKWPDNFIDHRDGRKGNNAWANLREATHGENLQNQRRGKSGRKDGPLGVHFCNTHNKWVAKISVNEKTIFLGNFGTAEEAHAAYVVAKHKLRPFGNL